LKGQSIGHVIDKSAIAIFVLLLSISVSHAEDISGTVTPDKSVYQPGDTVINIISVDIPRGFHLYGNPLGPGIGKALTIDATDSEGLEWVALLKTPAKKFEPDFGEWVWAYKRRTQFYLIGKISETPPETISGTITLEGVICEKSCTPFREKISFTLRTGPKPVNEPFSNAFFDKYKYEKALPMDFRTVLREKNFGSRESTQKVSMFGALGQVPDTLHSEGNRQNTRGSNSLTAMAELEPIPGWDYTPVEEEVAYSLWIAIFFGFIAGLILNVMPCVLPVLGIKIMSFSQGRHSSQRQTIFRSLFFAAGMVLIFMLLATFAAFANYSWGDQFKEPGALIVIICVIVLFALGLFDFYTILIPATLGAASQKTGKGYMGDFFRGMFTTILATPCSGPFLGATLAWTLSQPPLVIYSVFASIGIGMAFPYVLFASSKGLMKIIPKPGKWMDDFKHCMGFILLGMAVYLLIGLPVEKVIGTVGLVVFLIFGLAVYKRFAPFGSSLEHRIVIALPALLIAAAGVWINFGILPAFTSLEKAQLAEEIRGNWEPFTAQKLTEAHLAGQHVIVDFTAKWCMNCQFNKITVLHSKEVSKLLIKKNVKSLIADITSSQPVAESLLRHLGSRSVPFLAIFRGDDPYNPIIMRDVLQKGKLVKTLEALPEK